MVDIYNDDGTISEYRECPCYHGDGEIDDGNGNRTGEKCLRCNGCGIIGGEC